MAFRFSMTMQIGTGMARLPLLQAKSLEMMTTDGEE
jgi:hypothetical protein